jgi:cytochrome c-type biogenesis protein CcmF
VHFGMVVMFVALAGAAFSKETEKEMVPGEALKIGHYELKLESVKDGDNPNYSYSIATLQVLHDGQFLGMLSPEKRLYKSSQQPSSEVALRSTLREDLYVVFKGQSVDGTKSVIQVYLNPLVQWLWIGGGILVLGTIMAMIPNRIGGKKKKAAPSSQDAESMPESKEPESVEVSS